MQPPFQKVIPSSLYLGDAIFFAHPNVVKSALSQQSHLAQSKPQPHLFTFFVLLLTRIRLNPLFLIHEQRLPCIVLQIRVL